jgi:hypothetical protein
LKTDLYLLMLTEGRPIMTVDELAKLLGLNKRTLENRHYAHTLGIPLFKIEGGALYAHVADVAAHIEAQRAAATLVLQQSPQPA